MALKAPERLRKGKNWTAESCFDDLAFENFQEILRFSTQTLPWILIPLAKLIQISSNYNVLLFTFQVRFRSNRLSFLCESASKWHVSDFAYF